VVISAQIESELVDLSEAEAQGIPARPRRGKQRRQHIDPRGLSLVRPAHYPTTGEKETRAWTIRAGDKAPAAAGIIHSDFERGFIAAETVHYDDLVALGSFAKARESGKLGLKARNTS
jgi:ribosome-binding ATPase YchF (GTP1/OBG family)